MDLKDYRDNLRSAKVAVRSKENEIREKLQAIEDEKEHIIGSEERYRRDHTILERDAKQTFIDNKTAPIVDEIQVTKFKIDGLDGLYETKLAELVEKIETRKTNALNSYSIDTINSSIQELNNKLTSILGKRFTSAITEINDTNSVQVSENDFKELLQIYTDYKSEIEEIQGDSSGIVDTVFTVLNSLMNVDFSSTGKYANLIFSIVVTAVVALTFKFFIPVYVVLVLAIAYFNIRKHTKIENALVLQHIMEDNLQNIIDHIEKENADLFAKYKSTLENKIASDREKFNNELIQLEDKLEKTIMRADATFTFDSSNIEENINSVKEAGLRRIRDFEVSIADARKMLEELKVREQEALKAYELFKESESNSFFTPIPKPKFKGMSTEEIINANRDYRLKTWINDNVYLIDTVGVTPEKLELDVGSLVLFYDNDDQLNVIYDFLVLFIAQNMVRFDPDAVRQTVYDPVRSNNSFMDLKPIYSKDMEHTTENNVNFALTLLDMSSTAKEILPTYKGIIDKRREIIKSSGVSNIADYNRKMISINSVPLNYEYLVFINFTEMLSNENSTTILLNGANTGIMPILVIDRQEFKDSADIQKPLLQYIKSFYVVNDGKIQKRALDYVKEMFI